MGELEEVAQQCDMSVDELEQWTLWQGPEVGYYQTLDKKRITSSLLFSNGMRESGPSCQSKQMTTTVNLLIVGWSGLLMRRQGGCWGC